MSKFLKLIDVINNNCEHTDCIHNVDFSCLKYNRDAIIESVEAMQGSLVEGENGDLIPNHIKDKDIECRLYYKDGSR